MAKATWNGAVVAQAAEQDVRIVEGNVYFPLAAVNPDYLRDSATTTTCPWKGKANYYSLSVDGKTNTDAAWTYRAPLKAADDIAGRVAFWRGVEVER